MNDQQRLHEEALRRLTRRHLFRGAGIGLGSIALGSLLARDGYAQPNPASGMGPGLEGLHHKARAKNVIFLFMAGGPSQIDLFDPKPKLAELQGQVVPPSLVEGKRFAFIGPTAKLLASERRFARYGQCGAPVSELLPHTASIVDDLLFCKTVVTNEINHGPAKMFINSGSPRFGRPSMGSWVNYGISSANQDLPGFVVLQSGPRGPRMGAGLWSNGFLPSRYQGVPFRSQGDPILNLSSPPGHEGERQQRFYETVNALNRERLAAIDDDEIAARVDAYELAWRMQSSAPELIDLGAESADTLEMYGVQPGESSFAMNCLLARRMVERGVRFVQLYHTDWDHHGTPGFDLGKPLETVCRQVDRSSAALVTDLKRRGLLEDTLVIWGGEFGRTPMAEEHAKLGRDHHIDASTMWFAGGGVKAGHTVGETDELGFFPVDGNVHVHDIQATILHLLGVDHKRLTYRFQGRDFRLTDVAGEVVHDFIA